MGNLLRILVAVSLSALIHATPVRPQVRRTFTAGKLASLINGYLVTFGARGIHPIMCDTRLCGLLYRDKLYVGRWPALVR